MTTTTTTVSSPLQGTIVSLHADPGDVVRAGHVLALVESMKMHHDVTAPADGVVEAIMVSIGSAVMPGDPLVRLGPVPDDHDEAGEASPAASAAVGAALGLDRPDLAEVMARHAVGMDDARPDAVARRRRVGRRTARRERG